MLRYNTTVLLVAVWLGAQCTLAQYSSNSDNYRKGGPSVKMPIEMMLIGDGQIASQQGEYKAISKAIMDTISKMSYPGTKDNDYGKMAMAKMGGQQEAQYNSEPVRAAIKSRHSIDYLDVPNEPLNIMPQTILVEANNIPLKILFQSKSSDLNLQNEHIPSKGTMQETESEDEPHRLVHKVTKPIIQEVYEIITPYRKITQEVKPVQEEIQTIVARNTQMNDNKYASMAGSYGGNNRMNNQLPKLYSGGGGGSSVNKPDKALDQVMNMLRAPEMNRKSPYSMPTMSANGGYHQSMSKQSRMQLYMSQLNNQKQQQKKANPEQQPKMVKESEINSTPVDKVAYMQPIDEMVEQRKNDENGSLGEQQQQLKENIGSIALEQDVSGQSFNTDTAGGSENEKMAHSLMYFDVPQQQQQLNAKEAPSEANTNSRQFMQSNKYAESNAEPNGY